MIFFVFKENKIKSLTYETSTRNTKNAAAAAIPDHGLI